MQDEHTLYKKEKMLEEWLTAQGKVAVAYSGGVDSSFLLKTAQKMLGDRLLAVTARAVSFPESELEEAARFAAAEGIRQLEFEIDQFSIDGFADNPADRCYLCKKVLLGRLKEIAAENGFLVVCEGSNADDESDYRPGLRAIEELGIESPLKRFGFTRDEIRYCSEKMGLPTASKPSYACLATRFVYGERITGRKLAMAGDAEACLHRLGFSQLRVRMHGETLARIEVPAEDLPRLLSLRPQITQAFRSIGFIYVTMDLDGYRTGSMNEALASCMPRTEH